MDKFHLNKPIGELINPNNNNNNNINIGGNSSTSNNNNNNSRVRSKEMENMSFEISKYPRDLLQRLISLDDKTLNLKNDNENDNENIDGLNLGLGLSLGGKFGIDKYNTKSVGLIRSSSIASTMPLIVGQVSQEDGLVRTPSSLVRTSSLPVETEEEWRKRKEMQSLRRMEAKRRRFEKQRGAGGGGAGGGLVEEKSVESLKFRGRLEREQQSLGLGKASMGTGTVAVLSNNSGSKMRTTFGSLQGFLNAQGHGQVGQGGLMGMGQGGQVGLGQGQQGSSQGSGESLGGTNSSELESKTHQASSSGGEARSPASIQSLQERSSQEALGSPGTNKGDTSQRGGNSAPETSKQPKPTESRRQETGGSSSGIEDMPCVFTIGDGPNGRKVEGILYRYGKGEQVRIMCVCHGTFLSPKDFVKHAGGRDVEHPLRHIVVSPSSSVFH